MADIRDLLHARLEETRAEIRIHLEGAHAGGAESYTAAYQRLTRIEGALLRALRRVDEGLGSVAAGRSHAAQLVDGVPDEAEGLLDVR